MPKSRNPYLSLLLLLQLFLFGPTAFGNNVLTLSDAVERYPLGRHLAYFEDKTDSLPFAQIASENFRAQFQPSPSATPNFGYTQASVWLRVALRNNASRHGEWLLEVQSPRLNHADVYLVGDKDQVTSQVSGIALPFSFRAVAGRHMTFRLALAPGQEKTLFLRAQGDGSLQLPLVLWQPEAFTQADHDEQLLMGFYYGAIIAILLVNLMAFLTIRDVTFVYYMAYLMVFGLLQFAMNGHLFEYVFPDQPLLMQWTMVCLIALSASSALEFARAFLDLRQHMPRANRLLHFLSIVSLLDILVAWQAGIGPAIRIGTAFIFVISIVCFVVTFICLRKRLRQVRYFLIAWTGLLTGIITLTLKNFGFLPSVFITDYGMQIGSFFEFVLLTYALTDRVRIFKQENERIQREAVLTLENRVKERTRELVAQREVAERATRFKSEFLANMSHEIRTPMNAIVGLTQLALRTELSAKQASYLSGVTAAAGSLLGIIDDVLDFSKIEAGKLQLDHADFDLDRVVENVSTMTALQAVEKDLPLIFWIDPGVCRHLTGDALRLGQILLNLVNNAIKFTNQGEVRVQISQARHVGNELHLRVCVSDTGIGISREEVWSLFQPFNQADRSITRRYGGTGLGLVISKQLVDAMRGRIWVRSSPGMGSSFTFTVVLAVQSESCRSIAVKDAARERFAWANAEWKEASTKVLIVEDQEINRSILQEMLEVMGIGCHAARDGQEGVALALDPLHRFDLVLMDLQMPGMSGLQAATEIRKQIDRERLPIIALTAHVLPAERQRCMDAGMNDYLTKPLDPNKLIEVLARWVGPDAAARSSTVERPALAASLQYEVLPAVLPGFDDLDGALERVQQNAILLRKLIISFHEKFCDFGPDLRAALDAGDRETAAQLVHALKGNAGTLGAARLESAAGALADAMAQHSGGVEIDLLVAVEMELQRVLASAAGLRDAGAHPMYRGAPAEAQSGAEHRHCDALIGEISALLARNSMRAGKRFAELREVSCGRVSAQRLDDVERALERLDFIAAQAALDALAGDLARADDAALPATFSTG